MNRSVFCLLRESLHSHRKTRTPKKVNDKENMQLGTLDKEQMPPSSLKKELKKHCNVY